MPNDIGQDSQPPSLEPMDAAHCLDSTTELVIEGHGMAPDDDKVNIITVDKLADLLDLSVPTVLGFIKDGSITATRFGKQYRIWWPNVRDLLIQGGDLVPHSRSGSE